MKPRSNRQAKGVGLVETIVIAIVLVPVTLFFLDLIVLVLANSINDGACKNATRVAANQGNGDDAVKASKKAIEAVKTNSIMSSIKIVSLDYDEIEHKTCAVTTEIMVHLPIPFPGYSDIKFVAKDVEPILIPKLPK